MSRVQAWFKFMRQYFALLGILAGIPSLFVLALFLLRLNIDTKVVDYAVNFAWQYGYLFLIVIAIFAGAESTYKITSEYRRVAEDNFYNHSPQARYERAHLVFYNLLNEGKRHITYEAGKAQMPEWDKKVQQALKEYCDRQAIEMYYNNTGRYNLTTRTGPLANNQHENALKFLYDLVYSQLEKLTK